MWMSQFKFGIVDKLIRSSLSSKIKRKKIQKIRKITFNCHSEIPSNLFYFWHLRLNCSICHCTECCSPFSLNSIQGPQWLESGREYQTYSRMAEAQNDVNFENNQNKLTIRFSRREFHWKYWEAVEGKSIVSIVKVLLFCVFFCYHSFWCLGVFVYFLFLSCEWI